MSGWAAVIVSALVLLVGSAAQLALFAFGNGRMRGAHDAMAVQVKSFSEAVDRLASLQNEQGVNAARHEERLAATERAVASVQGMTAEFIAMKATVTEQNRQMRADIAKLTQRAEHT